MSRYARSHLSDPSLLQSAATHAGRERASTADLLADLAEIDERRLYLPAGYPSLFAWCVGELRLSDDAAFKRIKAARAARRFPAIFEALAEGRLHLTAVVLLAPHLTEDTADELLVAATHRTKSGIEQLLAERFPISDMLAWVTAIPASSATRSAGQQAPGPVEGGAAPESVQVQQAPGPVEARQAPGHVGDRSRVQPLSAQSFGVQFTLSRSGQEKLRYAQDLLGHQIPSGDVAAVFERALDALIPELERRRFAATAKPMTGRPRATGSTRHIPARVRREVWERDGGRCTFVGETGHRCEARARVEFDHIEEVARGGEATVDGIRLRCRAHNQYGAECTFGPEFMRHKRIAAAEARAAAKARRTARTAAARAPAAVEVPAEIAAAGTSRCGPTGDDRQHAPEHPARLAQLAPERVGREQAPGPVHGEDRDVVPWLRSLGFSAAEARRASERCADIPDAPLEQRVRVALSSLRLRGTRMVRAGECREATGSLAGAAQAGNGP